MLDRRPTPGADACGDHASVPAHVLAERIAAGDHCALEAFYRAWFERSVETVRSFTRRDESFCLDIVHDAMLRVVAKIRPMPSEAALERWMTRVLYTTAIDRIRKDTRRANRERSASQVENSLSIPTEDIEHMRVCLTRLHPNDRDLLLQRFARDRTLRAIAETNGITENAAHGRIRRIIALLRRTPR